jgi:protein-tyrosine phosphatase
VTTWTPHQPGVLTLPDGTLVRGRGLRRGRADGDVPEFGLYLLGREPEPSAWESAWIPWPDFRTPRDRVQAHRLISDAHARAAEVRVEVACGGGRGRTGTALACMATLGGLAARDAVAYVRDRYDRHAVETPFQRRFVAWFAAQPR